MRNRVSFNFSFMGDCGSKHISIKRRISSRSGAALGLNSYITPWGLPALMSIKQDRVGLSMAAHELHWLSQSSTPQPGMHRYLDKYFYWLPHIPIGHILSPNGIRQVELCANSTNKSPLETANSFSIGFQRIKLFLSIPINIVG